MIYIINITVIFLFILFNESMRKDYSHGLQKRNILEKIMFIIAIGMMIFTASFRYDVGLDYNSYIHMFNLCDRYSDNLSNIPFVITLSNLISVETPYIVLNMIMAKLGMSATVFVGLISAVTIILFGKVIRKISSNPLLSLFALYILYFLQIMNLARQYFACAIVFSALPYLKKRKYIKYVLIVLIAAMFHTSALVCLVLPLVQRIKITYTVLIVYAGAALFSSIFIPVIIKILGVFGIYTGLLTTQKNMSIVAVLPWTVLVIIVFVHKRDLVKNEMNNIYMHCIMIAFLCSVLSLNMFYLHRIISFFGIYVVLFVPEILRCIKNAREKSLIIVGYMMLMIMVFVNNVTDKSNNYIPYESVYSRNVDMKWR